MTGKSNIALYDLVAANNLDLGGIGLGENIMRPPAINNEMREQIAQLARFYADLGGVNTVGGTGDVITVATAETFTALQTGLVLVFKAGAGNTTDATLNVDGLGAKHIHKFTTAEVALAAGDLVAGGKYLLIYDSAANSAAGAWIILNPSIATSTFSDATFRVQDNGDATKQLALEVSGLSTSTTRTLTATDKSGTLILAADTALGLGMINGTLVTSVAGSALTIAIKTLAGNDPSAGDPVIVAFRDPTAATGDYQMLALTAAISLVISSGSTMGFNSGEASRLWIVAFNDAGTFRLGAVNARSATSIMALRDDILASSTAEGGAGAADSAQVIYTGTAVTAKANRMLGYAEWSAGLATAGTWGIVPTKLQLFGPGVSKPGDVVQSQRVDSGAAATTTTAIPNDDTIPQNTEGAQVFSQAITPASAANLLRVRAAAVLSQSSGTFGLAAAIFRDAAANASTAAFGESINGSAVNLTIDSLLLAGATAATTFKMRVGSETSGTLTFNGLGGSRRYGGIINSFLEVSEIMA